jgi:hypothetical protein
MSTLAPLKTPPLGPLNRGGCALWGTRGTPRHQVMAGLNRSRQRAAARIWLGALAPFWLPALAPFWLPALATIWLGALGRIWLAALTRIS